MISHRKGELLYFTFSILDKFPGLTHAVSSRLGGVSEGCYRSLNIGFHVGDKRWRVLRNRKILCQALGLPLDSVVAGEQVHGTRVRIINKKEKGKGGCNHQRSIPQTDALITRIPDISLLAFTADCPVLLLFDPAKEIIGLVHAGWRGSTAKIVQRTIWIMKQKFTINPEHLLVGISPSIGPCCYQIGEYVLEKLIFSFPEEWKSFVHFRKGVSIHLNLWELNRYQLLTMGVKDENIELAGICSACHHDVFFSHRGEEGKTGRCAVVVSNCKIYPYEYNHKKISC